MFKNQYTQDFAQNALKTRNTANAKQDKTYFKKD